jgi:hypothetical protein
MNKLRIIIGGYIGLYPTGGAAWDYVQYPLGLLLLGHDVYYIEDTRQFPVYQKEGKAWNDASDCINHLKNVMERFGLGDRWAYRDVASGECFGMSLAKVQEVARTADVFINISCSTFIRDEYLSIPKRILLDSDPMFTQVQCALETVGAYEEQELSTVDMVAAHSHHFTFGENIGAPDCHIPQMDFRWRPTRQPVCMQLWKNVQENNRRGFTSIMNWSGRKKLIYENEEWGQKDVEFEKFKRVPDLLPAVKFEVVVNRPLNKESSFSQDELERLGWSILQPSAVVGSDVDYKNFILQSTAEFGVAKETYVKSNSGWFSCRSACYLAAGKPVVAQDTQWSRYIPSGEGLFAFTDVSSAVDSIREAAGNLKFHAAKAKEIAHEYFDSSKVLTKMLQELN